MNEKKLTKYLLKRLGKYSPWTYVHSVRVNDYAMKIGRCLGFGLEELETLSTAAKLHDIGKMAVPVDILDKAAALTEEEYGLVKCHTAYGYLFLGFLDYPRNVCEAVRDHHERYDGKGYGEKKSIGIYSGIICASDSYDAMKSGRPYRGKFTDEEIYQEMAAGSGKQFDPEVCAVALRILF